jgi:hypothetical protein
MWRIFVSIGVLLLIIGVFVDGRNPIVAVQESMRSPTPSNTATPTHTMSPTVTRTPTMTLTLTPSMTPLPTQTETPTLTPKPKKLRFYQKNTDDKRGCMSVQIRGISAKNWTLVVKNQGVGATFDGGGNARVCGLKKGSGLRFTVFNIAGRAVIGGVDVRARDKAIMIADWR